ncbi:helix-turn-helix domain-containing protein [Paenibacillus sp. FSL W8-0187]|uniref:helix-turn-helix domain-containing protein n=1 Tax=unclassified Paenibacillus TaxID=185978 RepID=UPI0030DAE90F
MQYRCSSVCCSSLIEKIPSVTSRSNRIEYAKTCLLKNRKALISEIALDSGFVNDAQFCSMFKRATGMTPTKYREQVSANTSYNNKIKKTPT